MNLDSARTSDPTPSSSPRKVFYLLAVLLGIILALVLLELTVSILWPAPPLASRRRIFIPDPRTGFRMKPGSRFLSDAAPINSWGHRDDEVVSPKPPGRFRILLLGDSFTIGANIRRDEVYGQRLETLLGDRIGSHVEVANSGVGGWSPFQYAQYLEFDGWKLEPDMVLVGFFVGNDTFNTTSTVEECSTVAWGRLVPGEAHLFPLGALRVLAYEHSHVIRRLTGKGARARRSRKHRRERACDEHGARFLATQRYRLANHLPWSSETATRAAETLRQLERIRRATAAREVPLVVVLIPDETQTNPSLRNALGVGGPQADYDWRMPQAFLVDELRRRGFEVLDLLPDFLADPRCLWLGETHWNTAGHALAAKVIAERLAPRIAQAARETAHGPNSTR